MALERELVIKNREGLHFRPIMQVVDTATKYRSRVAIHCDGRVADACSPMELLMLVATQGSVVRLVAEGDDAQEAVDALSQLFDTGFGET